MSGFELLISIVLFIGLCGLFGTAYIFYMVHQAHKETINRIKEREAQKANMK